MVWLLSREKFSAVLHQSVSSRSGNASILTFPIQKVARYTLFDAITDRLCVKGIPVPLPTSLLMPLPLCTTLLTTLPVKGMLNAKKMMVSGVSRFPPENQYFPMKPPL
jgi:hypothetical protein